MATLLKEWDTYFLRSGSLTPMANNDVMGTIRVYLDSQDIATNTSTIKIEHRRQTHGTAGMTCYIDDQVSSYRCNNGSYGGTYQTISNYSTVSYTGTGYDSSPNPVASSYTTTHTVTHNEDGTCQLYVNGSYSAKVQYVPYETWGGPFTRTSSFNVALPTIPRYATINSFTLNKASGGAGLSGLVASWSVSNTCDAVEYSLNGGGWTSSGTSGTSGSFNISGLTPNTQYSLKIRVKRTDSQLWTESGTIYQTTYDHARVTGADSINDDGSPYMTFTNPSGAVINAYIEYGFVNGSATASLERTNIPNTGSYLFTLTSGEKSTIYSKMTTSNSQTIRYVLVTVVGGVGTYWSWLDRTFTIVNANPTFTTWTYADTNATTVALTGNNQKIIKGYSNVKATITSANKMVANKGATATSYQLTIGTKPSATVAYSSSSTVEMTVNAVDNNVFNCYAIDSRGNSTNVIKTLTTDYINYTPISITSASATRTDDIGTETTLAFSGKIFDGSFGSVSNSVKNATYKFKKTTDSSYTDGTSVITPTKTGGTFSFSGTIKGDEGSGGVDGFDATYSYNVQVIITDELSTHTFSFILGSGKPNLAMHRDGIAINQAYDETLGGALQVNGSLKIPSTADVSLSSTDNPIQIGPTSGTNLVMNNNEIMARNNGVASTLHLNNDGGSVLVNGSPVLTENSVTTYDYTLTPITSSYAAAGWRTMATDYTTGVIPAGTYLMIFRFTVGSSQPGMGLTTTRPIIDGNELNPQTRITIPTGDATMSGIIVAPVTFSTGATHTLNGHTYPLYQAITGGTLLLTYSFIRLK